MSLKCDHNKLSLEERVNCMRNDATTYCETRIEQLGFTSTYRNLLATLLTEWPEQLDALALVTGKLKSVSKDIKGLSTHM